MWFDPTATQDTTDTDSIAFATVDPLVMGPHMVMVTDPPLETNNQLPLAVQSDTNEEIPTKDKSKADEILSAPIQKGRWVKISVVVGLLLTGILVSIPKDGRSLAAETPQVAPVAILAAAIPTADQVASNDQVEALSWFNQNGSFKGFEPNVSTDHVYSYFKEILIIGRDYEDECWVYSVIDSTPSEIAKDESGYGCTPAAVDQFDKRMRELN